MYIYREERWRKEKTYGWMERGSLYVGKNLKNHWRAQRKWGREKMERRAKPGEEPRKEEKLKNEQEKKLWGGWIKTVLAWGKLGKVIKPMHGRRKMEKWEWRTKRWKLDRALGLLSLAPVRSCAERSPVHQGWWEREYEKHISQQTPTQLK